MLRPDRRDRHMVLWSRLRRRRRRTEELRSLSTTRVCLQHLAARGAKEHGLAEHPLPPISLHSRCRRIALVGLLVTLLRRTLYCCWCSLRIICWPGGVWDWDCAWASKEASRRPTRRGTLRLLLRIARLLLLRRPAFGRFAEVSVGPVEDHLEAALTLVLTLVEAALRGFALQRLLSLQVLEKLPVPFLLRQVGVMRTGVPPDGVVLLARRRHMVPAVGGDGATLELVWWERHFPFAVINIKGNQTATHTRLFSRVTILKIARTRVREDQNMRLSQPNCGSRARGHRIANVAEARGLHPRRRDRRDPRPVDGACVG